MHPLIVESVSNPTLLTREIIPEDKKTKNNNNEYDAKQLSDFFRTNLEKKIKVNQQLSMKQLEIIVEIGLGLSDLFEKSSKNSTKIESFANELLYKNYRYVNEFIELKQIFMN